MPPRRRAASAASTPDKSGTLALGIVGTGVLDTNEIEATLNDLFDTKGISKVECYFALTDDGIGTAETPGAYAAFQYVVSAAEQAGEGELTVYAVTYQGGNADDKALHEEAVESKVAVVPIVDQAAVTVVDQLAKAKAAGADARLLVFWVTEEDETADTGAQYAALESAAQAGIDAFNICNGMDDMNLGQPEAEEAPAPEPEAEAEAPRRGRGRPRAAAAPEPEAAAVEEEKPPTRTRRARASAPAEADEAQQVLPLATSNGTADLSDAGVGDIIGAFAKIIAKEVVALLKDQTGEETAPARRGR